MSSSDGFNTVVVSEPRGIWLLRMLLVAAFAAVALSVVPVARLASGNFLLQIVSVFTSAFLLLQILPNWIIYAAARRLPRAVPRPPDLSVDVFLTTFNEPFSLVETSMIAACALRGQHTTYLLDDGRNPSFEALAQRLGAVYLTRDDSVDAKAGNINSALPRSSGDVIAIFDVDHVPSVDYLEATVGHFANPKIGFVQTMLTVSNSERRWVAHAASETMLDFFNPTSLGMDALNGTTMMGSNSIVRREALISIGGYKPGLAEDLATSMAIHHASWHSAYVREPLAPGLAPEDVASWFVQQMKWARGVFEVLLTQYPRSIGRLTIGQRLTYLMRMTSYFIGPLIAVYLAATICVLLFDDFALADRFQAYLIACAPVAIVYLITRPVAVYLWRHPSVPSRPLWRAVALVYFTWPIYALSFSMAFLRMPLKFRPTPKEESMKINSLWLMPQLIAAALLVCGISTFAGRLLRSDAPFGQAAHFAILLGFALLQLAAHLLVFAQRLQPARLRGLLNASPGRHEKSGTGS